MPRRVPGRLEALQSYNDAWRGWPVLPLTRQHPVRGSFLDPRPDPKRGAIYHTGVDVAVRDDRPERGAPAERTHAVFAVEGGLVHEATRRGSCGFARVGHFGYGHIDPLVEPGRMVEAAQQIGWTCRGYWPVHLSEFIFTADGGRLVVNPLRRGGELHPYTDRAAPRIQEIRFYAAATPRWRRRFGTTVALLPQAGRRLNKSALTGRVDVRVRVSDPQSFIGWFGDLPQLAAPHHPFRLAVTIVRVATGEVVERREVFRAEQLLDLRPDSTTRPEPSRTCPRAAACSSIAAPVATASTGSASPPSVLEHRAACRRPLPPAHPRVGCRGEHEQGGHGGHPQKRRGVATDNLALRDRPRAGR